MENLAEKDLKYIWHPCSQMKDYEELKPIVVDLSLIHILRISLIAFISLKRNFIQSYIIINTIN